MGGSSDGISDGDCKLEGSTLEDDLSVIEGDYSWVSGKGDSEDRVDMVTGLLVMGSCEVVTVRVVMAAGTIERGAYVVVGAAVEEAEGSSSLRSGVRCSGASGEESGLVGVSIVTG